MAEIRKFVPVLIGHDDHDYFTHARHVAIPKTSHLSGIATHALIARDPDGDTVVELYARERGEFFSELIMPHHVFTTTAAARAWLRARALPTS